MLLYLLAWMLSLCPGAFNLNNGVYDVISI